MAVLYKNASKILDPKIDLVVVIDIRPAMDDEKSIEQR
jgi:hypothetical protein